MTKEEAKAAIARGYKITHTYFDDYEFVRINAIAPSMYVFEDGVNQTASEFWDMRNDEDWNGGWSIYNEK